MSRRGRLAPCDFTTTTRVQSQKFSESTSTSLESTGRVLVFNNLTLLMIPTGRFLPPIELNSMSDRFGANGSIEINENRYGK